MDFFGYKRRRREAAAEVAYKQAVEVFEIEQSWRVPGWEYEPLRKALRSEGPQRNALDITIDGPRSTDSGVKPSAIRTRPIPTRVVKQGPRAARIEDLWFERPFVKVFYSKGHLDIKVDRERLHELRDTAKLYIGDPRLIIEKAQNRAHDRYLERRRLDDAAIFM